MSVTRWGLPWATCLDRIIRSSLEKTVSTVHENRTLTTLRDTLLPKLISGELRVSDAEKFIDPQEAGYDGFQSSMRPGAAGLRAATAGEGR